MASPGTFRSSFSTRGHAGRHWSVEKSNVTEKICMQFSMKRGGLPPGLRTGKLIPLSLPVPTPMHFSPVQSPYRRFHYHFVNQTAAMVGHNLMRNPAATRSHD